MRKEQLVAIILGSAIGVAVAFSLWKFSRSANTDPQSKNQVNNSTVTTNTGVSNEFTVTAPIDFSVIREEDAAITGLANANSVVVAYGEEISFAKSNQSGEFSVDLPLASGLNKVKILAFEPGQKAKETSLTLIHSTAIAESTSSFTSQLGTITDVTENTLQLRALNGEIKQLSVNDDTTYAKIIDDTEDIEFSDVAIGDYVAAIGQMQSNVMNVSRILVTTEPEEPSFVAVSGSIETLSAREFLVKSHETGELVSIDATGGATTYSAREGEITTSRLSTADEGDEIIIVGEMEAGELIADTIILL